MKFKRRAYNKKQKKNTKRFRLVTIYNEEAEKYHMYITNIPVEHLNNKNIAILYSAK